MTNRVNKIKLPKLPTKYVKISFPKSLIPKASQLDKKVIVTILIGIPLIIISIFASKYITENYSHNNNTSALYFFSAVAQTLGALLGIVLAATYVILPNIKTVKDSPAQNIIRRLLLSDPHLIKSVIFGFISIILSLFMLVVLYIKSSSFIIVLVAIISILVIYFSILSTISMYTYIFKKTIRYLNPLMVNDIFLEHEDKNIVNSRLIDWIILFCFLEALYPQLDFSSSNSTAYLILRAKNQSSYFIETLFMKIEKDIANIDEVDRNKYNQLITDILIIFTRHARNVFIDYFFKNQYNDFITKFIVKLFPNTTNKFKETLYNHLSLEFQFIFTDEHNININAIENYLNTIFNLIDTDYYFILYNFQNSYLDKTIQRFIELNNNEYLKVIYYKLKWYTFLLFAQLTFNEREYDDEIHKEFISIFNFIKINKIIFHSIIPTYTFNYHVYKVTELMCRYIFNFLPLKGNTILKNNKNFVRKVNYEFFLDRLTVILKKLNIHKIESKDVFKYLEESSWENLDEYKVIEDTIDGNISEITEMKL